MDARKLSVIARANLPGRLADAPDVRLVKGLTAITLANVPRQAPLSTLLSRVSAAFTADFERRLSAAGFGDLTFSLGTNVLRFLRPGPVRMSLLAEMSGVTKQAISQQVAYLQAHGYVTVEPDAADSRAKLVRLSATGQRANETAESLFAAVERDWRHRFGGNQMRELRTLLEDILDRNKPSC
jgi:DNA-binding MarR family transcriptional regulator